MLVNKVAIVPTVVEYIIFWFVPKVVFSLQTNHDEIVPRLVLYVPGTFLRVLRRTAVFISLVYLLSCIRYILSSRCCKMKSYSY